MEKAYELPCFNAQKYIVNQMNPREYQLLERTTGKSFCIGTMEYQLLCCCDGKSSIQDLTKNCAMPLTENDWCHFILLAQDMGLLEQDEPPAKEPLDIRSIKLPLVSVTKLFFGREKLAKALKWLLYSACLVSLLAIAYMSITRSAEAMAIFQTMNLFQWSTIGYYFISFFILALFHEFAHAIVLASFGVLPGRMGIMLSYFQPACYVEVSGINKLKTKSARIQVWIAGVLAQVIWLAISLVILLYAHLSTWVHDGMVLFLLVNFGMLIFNLFFVVSLDGYHILCELLDDQHLRENAFAVLLQRREVAEVKTRYIYCVVGILCAAYMPAFMLAMVATIAGFFFPAANIWMRIAMPTAMGIALVVAVIRWRRNNHRRGEER